MEYKGFTIQENKMKYVYGNKKWEVTNYLVYKEDNGGIKCERNNRRNDFRCH